SLPLKLHFTKHPTQCLMGYPFCNSHNLLGILHDVQAALPSSEPFLHNIHCITGEPPTSMPIDEPLQGFTAAETGLTTLPHATHDILQLIQGPNFTANAALVQHFYQHQTTTVTLMLIFWQTLHQEYLISLQLD
ncbi:hypothetical protein KI387_035082, partial [Taxus chinensis]